jgi:hypothetical protein
MLSIAELRRLLPAVRINEIPRIPALITQAEFVVAPCQIFPLIRYNAVCLDFLFHNRDPVATRTIALNRQPAASVGPNATYSGSDLLIGVIEVDNFVTNFDLSLGLADAEQVKRIKVDDGGKVL